jgi:hypothetical protein
MWRLRTRELVILYGAGVLLGAQLILLLTQDVARPLGSLLGSVAMLLTTAGIRRTARRHAKASAG